LRIIDVVCSKGMTGFFFDDQRAIKKNAVEDGASYKGKPVIEGFSAIRQAGESMSLMLVLGDGQIAYGDCAAVQYSGTGGRDPLFLAQEYIPIVKKHIAPILIGREISSFKHLAEEIDKFITPDTGATLHTALRYGLTQALLDARAKSRHKLMAEIIAEEYGTQISQSLIPVFTQSGDDRYYNVDKMIIKRSDVIPHGLINNVGSKLGFKGEILLEYIRWLKNRVHQLKPDDKYMPVLHIDVYGTIGLIFGNDCDNIAQYLQELEQAALPLKLRIEGPVDAEERESQMLILKKLTKTIDKKGINVEIVADEWCNTLEDIKYFADNRAGHMVQIKTPDLGGINNTIEAVLYCKQKGIGAYLGGTCNETDRSAQISAHIAMATQPDQILAKPGMGVDEGFMIVYNEMQRILALLRRKASHENG